MLRSISRVPIRGTGYLSFCPSLAFVNSSSKVFKNHSIQKFNLTKNFSSTPNLNNGVISQTFETIIQYNSSFLQELHHCGQSLPIDWEWYYTIILSTVLIRGAITLPIAIYNLKQVKKRKEMNHVLSAWNSSYSKRPYIEFNKPNHEDKSLFSILDETKSMAKNTTKNIQAYYNMNPYTSWMLPWTQIPIFIINSSTIRAMCGLPAFSLSIPELFESEFANGGTLWFTSLLQTDPTMILPLCIGACHIANLSLSLEAPKQPQASKDSKVDYTLEPPPKPSKTQQIVKKTFTTIGGVMSIAFIPIAAISPSGLALYWLTSALFSLIQNITLRTKLAKKIFNY